MEEWNEEIELLDDENFTKEYLDSSINYKRVAQFKYKGYFSDLNSLQENYLWYIYYKNENNLFL